MSKKEHHMNKSFQPLFILFLCFIGTSVFASDQAKQGIEVTGKGFVDVSVDLYIVSILISEHGFSATKSQQLVEYKSQLIKNSSQAAVAVHFSTITSKTIKIEPSIKINGVIVKERFANGGRGEIFVSSNNASVSKHSDYGQVNQQQTQILTEVSQEVTVKFADITSYHQLLDNLVKVGVSHIGPLQTIVSEKEKYYQQALDEAVQNAKKKANKLAKQMGIKLGHIQFIQEQSQSKNQQEIFNGQTLHYAEGQSLTNNFDHQIFAEVIVHFNIEN